jgi:Down syndrome cell adhesion molecule-like protein 1
VGDRASITCSVIKGDTPLNVRWLKNGAPIDPSQRIVMTQVDQYNSILVIEHLSAAHSGNYSCVVSNPAAEVESSQALLVNGKILQHGFFIKRNEQKSAVKARGARKT